MREEWTGPWSIDELLNSRGSGYWGDAEASSKRAVPVRVVRNGDISPHGKLLGGAPRFFSEREHQKALVTEGDVLLTSSGDVGKVCLPASIPEGLVVSNFVRLLRPETELVSGAFLRLVLEGQATRAVMAQHTAGSTIPNLLTSYFSARYVMLPPLALQRRVVDLIAHLDEHLTRLSEECLAVEKAARALRHHLFSGLDAPEARAGEVFDMLLGRQKSARQSVGEYVIPYLRAANVGDSQLRLGDVQSMNFEPHEQARYGLRPGDVLLVEGGTVGLAAHWSGEIAGPVGFDKHLIRMRAIPRRSISDYALQWAKWSRDRGAFDAQATGITIRALGFARACAMPVPDIPSAEQDALCRPLAAIDAMLASLRVEGGHLEALRRVVLHDLLAGTRSVSASNDTSPAGAA